MSEPLPPAAYAEILASAEAPLLVGGQAVNLWAELYAAQAPALARFAPFTSADADIYGTKDYAATLAQRTGWACHYMQDPASVAVAVLLKPTTADRPPLTIEVLREVNGLTEADLGLDAVVELADGHRYRVPSPLVLLKAKLYNLVSLANLDRPQDVRHTRMLLEIIPHYLKELAVEYRAGRLQEENLLGAICYCGDVVLAPFAGNAGRSYGLDLDEIFSAELHVGLPQGCRAAIERIQREARARLGKREQS